MDNSSVRITCRRLFCPSVRDNPNGLGSLRVEGGGAVRGPPLYFRAVEFLSRGGCARDRGTPVADPAGHKGVKPMMSFRKHAAGSTRRPDSFLRGRARGAKAGALLALLLLAQTGAPAATRPQKQQVAPAEPAVEAKIPIRVKRVETPDGPGVVATIGEFPEDLNEAGQEFLKREFFEHFATDVLGFGETTPGTTLKVAMLPQEKDNQRECDFTAGKVAGHIVVLVEKRRVLIACTFSEVGRKS